MFNISKTKEVLNSSVRRGKISPNTAKAYLRCLIDLNDVLGEEATSRQIREAIDEQGNSAMQYMGAVSFYERKVLGHRLLMTADKGPVRVNQQVRELDYGPTHYRNLIRHARNRFVFTVQERAGLRVSEACALLPEDFEINGDEIIINVRHGKGGKQRYVHCLYSQYLLNEIPNMGELPSEASVKKEAYELGFRTHDLRKLNARTRFWTEKAHGKNKKQALKAIKDELGHESTEITKRYVGKEYDKRKNNLGY